MTPKILIFAEAVTLAHVARASVFAETLANNGYKVALAVSTKYNHLIDPKSYNLIKIKSISSKIFLDRLNKGLPLYTTKELTSYIMEETKLLTLINPDLVIGDFRLSLGISTKMLGYTYLAITNAYWSPYYKEKLPLPVLSWTNKVPEFLAKQLFNFGHKYVIKNHVKEYNEAKKAFAQDEIENDIRKIYTDADYVAYSDSYSLFPIDNLPDNHSYVPPIVWQPECVPITKYKGTKPLVYINMGTSGDNQVLDKIILTTKNIYCDIVVAENSYLPGIDICKQANLMICNGGSLSTAQAIFAGIPVLGITSNMDQFLNMQTIERYSIGKLIRADRVNSHDLSLDIMFYLSHNNTIKTFIEHSFAKQYRVPLEIKLLPLVEKILNERKF